jgi:molecular chaperone DnaJ
MCKGTGAGGGISLTKLHSSSTSFGNCRDCGGKGVLHAVIPGTSLTANVTTPCPTCSNSNIASLSSKDNMRNLVCTQCSGNGKVASKKTCTVNVPAGVSSGMQQVFEGEGDEAGDGCAPGDLIICFEVEGHPFYQRHGDDVYCKVPIPFPHSTLGTKLEIPSIYGEPVSFEVAPLTQHKHVIKVSDEGFFNAAENKRGDMYLQIIVELPKSLTDEEKKLLQKLSTKDNFKSKFSAELHKTVPPPPF